MPRKGMPIRYGQKQPGHRQQGARGILQRSTWICKQGIFPQRSITGHLAAVFGLPGGMAGSFKNWDEV